MGTPEYLNFIQFPILAYALVGRAPEMSGFLAQVNALRGGESQWSLVNRFIHSPEFVQRYGVLPNQGFAARMYLNLFNRGADGGGLTHWTDQLNRGLPRPQLVLTFMGIGNEMATSHRRAFVQGLYLNILRRTPAQWEQDGWVHQLQQGVSEVQAIGIFLDSEEHRRLYGCDASERIS